MNTELPPSEPGTHEKDSRREDWNVFENEEPLVHMLHLAIRFSVRVLAVLMTLVIIWSVADVAWTIYGKVSDEPPYGLLTVNDILATFGTFMAVLIAIEIFVNIVLYLRDEVLQVKLVIATALMAIARKVIVLDYKTVEPEYVWATAAVIFALSIGYWLISKKS
jgi:uncharacterized membrane protein (DUF373 family)